MTTEKSSWEIRMQIRKGGKIRTISRMLSYEEAMKFLSFVSNKYYGFDNPRIWAHDITEDTPVYERNITLPQMIG